MTAPGARLRAAIAEGGLARIMACHSPLSALLAEQAGFDGVWASGFELSALYGLPDAGLVSMSQHLDMVRAIAARVAAPVVADLDTGFGNAVNLMHAVRLYEAAGVAALVIEDKTFPKMTSLLPGGRQELARTEEFAGKIAAALAARRNPSLIVVARTEALIAGAGQAEALSRATAYQAAGADMILVHSKDPAGADFEAFARAWTGSARLVVVPTAFPHMDAARLRALGNVGMVIHGNHAIRASVAAMRETFGRIAADGGAAGVEASIATVGEIFDLQGMADVADAEARFLK